MYYLEVRFLEKDKAAAAEFVNIFKERVEIISIIINTYYICYTLGKPLEVEVHQALKNKKLFYFMSYYKI